jgi:hypothetical protein
MLKLRLVAKLTAPPYGSREPTSPAPAPGGFRLEAKYSLRTTALHLKIARHPAKQWPFLKSQSAEYFHRESKTLESDAQA